MQIVHHWADVRQHFETNQQPHFALPLPGNGKRLLICRSPLLADNSILWGFAQHGDKALVPLFPYRTKPGLSLMAAFGGVFESGMRAIETLLPQGDLSKLTVHLVLSNDIYPVDAQSQQHRYAMGIAAIFQG